MQVSANEVKPVANDKLEELAERIFRRLAVAQDATPRRDPTDYLPLVAASHFAGHFATAGWANRCGLHAVSLGTARQAFEALSIIELGLLGDPGKEQLQRWERDSVTAGGIRKWLQANAWPGYPDGLAGAPWTSFMESLGKALQPYAHFSPGLLQWNLNMVTPLDSHGGGRIAAVGPSYDVNRAARIQLLRGALLWSLGKVVYRAKPPSDTDTLYSELELLGDGAAKSEWLISADWSEVLTPHVWDQRSRGDA